MEAKYYVPTESEFCVGLKYQEFVKHKGWVDRIVLSISEDLTLNSEGFCIDFPEDFRIKALDRSDIEECGWVMSDFSFEIIDGMNAFVLRIIDFDKMKVLIHKYNDAEPTENIFKGEIKNKSELKRVMKMLGIQ